MKDHEEIVLLYRDRARRLRIIAEGLDDEDHAKLLTTVADDYEELADRMIPPQ